MTRSSISMHVDGIEVKAEWWLDGDLLCWAISSPKSMEHATNMHQRIGHPDDNPEREARAEITDFVRSHRAE